MKLFPFVLLCMAFTSSTIAQMPGGRTGARRPGNAPAIGHMYGKLVDSKTNKGIDAASVQLLQTVMDSVSKKKKDTIITGMLTRPNGDFSLENLPVLGNFILRITAIGYKNLEKKVGFDVKPGQLQNGSMDKMAAAFDKDLGNIKMTEDATTLEGVTVTGSKPAVQMAIDRKIFNVEKNISSIGGTAVDVMRNVPSVQVDIDGNVSLRNASPQLFVDGRPTTLTLDQIPADAIQSVEVITNPSAKYDASGGTAGILNVVLKKNRKAGYSGNVKANVDSRGRIGGGFDLNVKQGKVNVFGSANINQRKSVSKGETERYSFFKEPFTNLTQLDRNTASGYFGFGRLGIDYLADNRNTISLTGNIMQGKFKPYNESDIWVDTLLSGVTKTSFSERFSNTSGRFRNLGTTLSYKRNFTKSGQELTADVNYNRSNNNNNNNVVTNAYSSVGGPLDKTFTQVQAGSGNNTSFSSQIDYTNPIGETGKLEAGARIAIREINSKNDLFQKDGGSNLVRIPQLSSRYENSDKVYAGYLNYSNSLKEGKFGYQVGLRMESSSYNGTVFTTGKITTDSSVNYSNSFPVSLFPSIFLSQQLGEGESLQLNYSRRINRPNFFQLFPFTDYSDSLNLSRGNPNLVPEFTNSLELSYEKTYGAGNNFMASLYYKHTNDLITRYQSKETNPITDSVVLINTYINANSSYVGGLELTGRNNLYKWWELNTNLNFFTSKINTDDPSIPEQKSLFSAFFKINNNFKLPKNFTLQLSGDYTSKTVLPPGGSGGGGRPGGGGGMFGGPTTTAQGYVRPNYGVDMAIKYDFLKSKAASISLNINDILRTRKNDVHSESVYFVQDALRRRDAQVVRLSFNLRFGKFDASLFKRKNMKSNGENMMEGMQGMP